MRGGADGDYEVLAREEAEEARMMMMRRAALLRTRFSDRLSGRSGRDVGNFRRESARALETARVCAVGERGKIGERRRMRVKQMVLGMAATGKCAHSSSVAKSRALTALAALSSDYSEGEEREGNEKEEIVRRKEIEAFEDTTREKLKCKDALLLAVTLREFGRAV